jgi:3-deoxy-D-arabino-heptulosonate 7-phosphate (DAHP) synthase
MPDTYLVDITSEEENQFLAGLSLEKFWTAGKQSKQVEKKMQYNQSFQCCLSGFGT